MDASTIRFVIRVTRLLFALGTAILSVSVAPRALGDDDVPLYTPLSQGSPATRWLITANGRGQLFAAGCPEKPEGDIRNLLQLVETMRGENPELVWLDAGDLLFAEEGLTGRELERAVAQAEALAGFVGENGMSLANIGLNDLALGFSLLIRLPSPYFSNSYVNKAGNPFAPLKTFDAAGRKVGVIALQSSGPGSSITPFNVEFTPLGGNQQGNFIGDAEKATKVLENEGVESRVLLLNGSPDDAFEIAEKAGPFLFSVVSGVEVEKTEIVSQENSGPVFLFPSFWREAAVIEWETVASPQYLSFRSEVIDLSTAPPATDPTNTVFEQFRREGRKAVWRLKTIQPPPDEKRKHSARSYDYAGTQRCAQCHLRIFAAFSRTSHAKAFEAVEKSGRVGDEQCLPCHSTGFGGKGGFSSSVPPEPFARAGCETCHGPMARHADQKERANRKPKAEELKSKSWRRKLIAKTCAECHRRQPVDDQTISEVANVWHDGYPASRAAVSAPGR